MALISAAVALALGLVMIGALVLKAPVFLGVCLLVPPSCSLEYLPDRNYFWGDSQAAPTFHLLLNLGVPLLSLSGAFLASVGRRWVGFGLAVAALVLLLWAQIVSYFFFPLQTLMLVSVLATVVTLGRLMWWSGLDRGGPVWARNGSLNR